MLYVKNMTRQKILKQILGFIFILIILKSYVYDGYIAGFAYGPNFIQAIISGDVTSSNINSIEVLEPMTRYVPFTDEEMNSLRLRGTISSPNTIARLRSLMKTSQPGGFHQNHPSEKYWAYLKINTSSGFYWLHCKMLEDGNGAVFSLESNRLNATNPHWIYCYYLTNYSELFDILDDATKPKNAEKK